jgi:hypothetical protein
MVRKGTLAKEPCCSTPHPARVEIILDYPENSPSIEPEATSGIDLLDKSSLDLICWTSGFYIRSHLDNV